MDGEAIEVHFDEYRYYFEVPDVPGPGMHQIVISANIERYNPDRKFTATVDPDQGETGNTVTRQLDAEVTKPNRTLTASFEMPPSNVKLKLRVSFVYLVYIDDASKDYVKSDTKYAAEGDRVKLTLNDNGPFSPASVSAETSQTYQKVPIGDDREFVMPDDHVIISATITATRPDVAKDKEQSYVYNVTGPDNTRLTVALVLGQGETAGTAVIAKLPAGTYTVTEERSWSWRYSDGGTSTVTAAPNGIAETVFDHSLDLREWLNGHSHLQPSLTHP